MPFLDSQNRPKFIQIILHFCIQFTAQYIYNCLIRYLEHIKIIWPYFESRKRRESN